MQEVQADQRPVFDVLIDGRVPPRDAVLMGLQNVFVMTGCFVFPGILGRSFDLPVDTIASLYGANFIGCGITTLLMATMFGRMPLVAGPYAGVFAALITFGHSPGGNLGTAFGSLAAASLAWAVLSIPVRGYSVIQLLAKAVRNPAITGSIIMLVMMQISDLAFPHWLGKVKDPTYPLTNIGAGLVTAMVLLFLNLSSITLLKRLSLLIALIAGTLVFQAFHPIDLAPMIKAPWIDAPSLFAFGFSFNLQYAIVFFLVLIAVNIQTVALMGAVGEWAGEDISSGRQSRGVFAMMLGSAIASCIGSFSTIPYPACIALLRSTRVAARQVTIATGIILIAMGFVTKIDYLFVVMPVPVLGAAASVLFGMVFLHGVEMLAHVRWDQRSLSITGFGLMLGFGSLFIEPEQLKPMPLVVNLLLQQPIIIGVATMLTLSAILPRAPRPQAVKAIMPHPIPFEPKEAA
jgi:xanthine/uracil permease